MDLHYLKFRDYGRLIGHEEREGYLASDRRTKSYYVMADDELHSYLRIDEFNVDVFSGVRLIGSMASASSLHAEFNIAEGNMRIATWHRPVVKRLFWFGYPLQLTTWLDQDLQDRMRGLRDNPLDGLTKSIRIQRHTSDDAA